MSVKQKIEEARAKMAQRETWRKKIGFWRIMWIFGIGVAVGSSWLYNTQNISTLFESKTVNIIIEKAEAKELAPEAKIDAPVIVSVEEIADDIWNKESTRGKNNYSKCTSIGKINGIGYGIPGDGTFMCFDSHEEEMKVLEGWIISKRARGMSDQELMCLYSGSNYNFCK